MKITLIVHLYTPTIIFSELLTPPNHKSVITLQHQFPLQYLECCFAAQIRHVRLWEGVWRVTSRELRESAREHTTVAPVHLLGDVLQKIITWLMNEQTQRWTSGIREYTGLKIWNTRLLNPKQQMKGTRRKF